MSSLKPLVRDRLQSEGVLSKTWAAAVLAACDGTDALEQHLATGKSDAAAVAGAAAAKRATAYLTSLSVQGFRGIGPRQTIDFTPGPGLTVIVGRNGSGKSSFAEALEVLFTGDSKRWADRSKIWKDGWRNLHEPHPACIEADVLLEGQGPAKISCLWEQDGQLDDQKSVVQPKGKSKTSLAAMGWDAALVSYRPFLSYNELGSMLDEGPSKLYDALSLVLGLEDLVTADKALGRARLDRQKAFDAADSEREELIARLTSHLQDETDDRASACRDALSAKNWGVDEVKRIVAAGGVPAPDNDMSVLHRALSIDAGDPAVVAQAAARLREADRNVKALAGTGAEFARKVMGLLESALAFHKDHADADCPVCGAAGALTGGWAEASRTEIERLRKVAAESDAAYRAAEQAVQSARQLLTPPPVVLKQLFEITTHGLKGLDRVRELWTAWHNGSALPGRVDLAAHLEAQHQPLVDAVDELKGSIATEIARREDKWRPLSDALAAWLPDAKAARGGAELIPQIKEAEAWLKRAAEDLRNKRFAPIAEKAMATWQHLRQQSNVELGKIELVGGKTTRRVTLDVTVDGVAGAALGVMSQGELHSLALSLFLPRATLSDSPFRFVVIDDPVQSMDPARVDGLARALEATAESRQVIVFTHDDRLPDAIRRMQINSTILSVTRRAKSVVEVRKALDPVRALIEDALALVYTSDIPQSVVRRLVPGFCRSAIEAAFIALIRRRRLAAGRPHDEVEQELTSAGKVTPLAALAFFDDKDKGGDVMARLNRIGPWAGDVFKQCKEGSHQEIAGDLKVVIQDTERLTTKLQEMT